MTCERITPVYDVPLKPFIKKRFKISLKLAFLAYNAKERAFQHSKTSPAHLNFLMRFQWRTPNRFPLKIVSKTLDTFTPPPSENY